MSAKRIFIIDDEPDMLRDASDLLKDEGYEVSTASDPVSGLRKIKERPPDLILLDVRMPKMDGFQVCKELKADVAARHVPVIMVSVRTHETNVVSALELGAEDYIRKPYQQAEFLARIKAALRRSHVPAATERVATAGPLRLDYNRYEVFVDGNPVPLRPKEFELLAFFLQREGHVLTHATLSQQVWQTDFIPTSKTIYFHVEQLRKKLSPHGDCIQSLKGIGYRFEIPE